MRRSILAVLALAACVKPEQGIDDTTITGTVRIDPIELEEKFGNQKPDQAQPIDEVTYQYVLVEGSTDDWGTNPDGSAATTSDLDWYTWTATEKMTVRFHLFLGDAIPDPDADTDAQPPALPGTDTDTDADTDTDVPDTDTDALDTDDTDVVVDSGDTGEPVGPVVRIERFDLDAVDDEGNPTSVDFVDVDSSGVYELEAEEGVTYGFRLAGIVAPPDGEEQEVPYLLAIEHLHPDEAGIKVGAFQSADPTALGAPVGGTSVGAFELQPDFSYEGDYEILFVKAVTTVEDTDGTSESTVEEDLETAYLFAADWATLNTGLRAGTWYSSQPAEVALTADDIVVSEALALDAYAAAVIGVQTAEVEPNDVPATDENGADLSDPSTVQPLGTLSAIGFVDIVTGQMEFGSAAETWADHDVDAFSFQVPEPSQLFFTLDWATQGVDIDIIVFDADGNILDLGYYNQPEVNEYGTGELSPGLTYYVVILGWLGDPATPEPYELRLELASP